MKFRKWVDGEVDPLHHGMEIKIPEMKMTVQSSVYS